MRFGFCSGTYQSRSISASADRCIDLLAERVDSPDGKSRMMLVDRPGSRIFANLGATASLGGFVCRPNGSLPDRDFEVVQSGPNQSLIEVFEDGTTINRGQLIAPTTSNVTFADNGVQLGICTGGNIWVFTYATNLLTGPVAGLNGSVAMIEGCDTFGIALLSNSNKWQVSNALDFTTWPGLSVAQVSKFPDNVVSIIVNQSQVIFQGPKQTVPYVDAGFLNVPFVPVEGVIIQDGIAGQFCRARADNSIFWWDSSERGRGVCRRLSGYIPTRVSTHSIEILVGQYADISDAISWAEERDGHTLFVTYFPSGTSFEGAPGKGATMVYDISTGLWSEWTFFNQKTGQREAYHGRNHRVAWGKHLVGDWASGTLYETDFPRQSGSAWNFVTDAGNQIHRERIGPHVSVENRRIILRRLTLDVEVGISPQPPLTGPSSYPSQYFLPDANGNVWSLTCNDQAILSLSLAPAGSVAQKIGITDSVTKTSYLMTVSLDSQGNFSGDLISPTAFDPQFPTALPIATSSFLDCQIAVVNGQAQTIAPLTHPRGPEITLRTSRDGGHTWMQPRARDCGQAGQYLQQVFWDRLGQVRVWTPRITFSDPVPLRIIEAYLEGDGLQPMPRTIKQFQENA